MSELMFESISIELTKRCNLNCIFCYATPGDGACGDEITADRLCSFLKKFRECGGRRVLFTGGEVFLRRDLHEIVGCAVTNGLMVDLFSNGTLIERGDAEFIASHVNLINISIDGPASNHDHLRQMKGSYERTVRAIHMLHEAGARFGIQVMMVPDNLEKVDWLIELVKETQPMLVKLGHVSRMGLGKGERDLWLSDEQMNMLKAMTGIISERSAHFHARVITNIITAREFKAFYSSFKNTMQPWMLPDGRILSCYVCDYQSYWTYTSIDEYPAPFDRAAEKREKLLSKVYECASGSKYFDFLELTAHIAENIASENENRV